MKDKKLFAISGILAPILFFGIVIILGLLEPGYSHTTRMMSVLGGVGGIRGLIFNMGIGLIGVLIVLFAFGLHKNINNGKGSKIGPILLATGGFGLVLSGIFHCNLNCDNVMVDRDFIGIMHMLSAFIAGMCLSISPFFVFARFRKDDYWKRYAIPTLMTGILANIPGIILWITIFASLTLEMDGILQRLGIVFILIWMEVVSWKLLLLKRES
ncbi:MAG: DUF998 domain-containing protein [Candidatus Aminicenantes bacterium]|nr:DUF998 domain-containing protein [Candidatus Aminicenantes bacterium]